MKIKKRIIIVEYCLLDYQRQNNLFKTLSSVSNGNINELSEMQIYFTNEVFQQVLPLN